MQKINAFPITENKPIVAIDSGYSNTCAIKALLQNNTLYVEHLLTEKNMFLEEILHKYSEIFSKEFTYILHAACSSHRVYLREHGFSVMPIISHEITKDLFDCNIVIVSENENIDILAIIDKFKNSKDIYSEYRNNKLLWVLDLVISHFQIKRS